MKPKNIMDVLTPQPPFNPARKNEAVKFNLKKANTIKSTKLKLS